MNERIMELLNKALDEYLEEESYSEFTDGFLYAMRIVEESDGE